MQYVKAIRIVSPTILELVREHTREGEKTATGVAERLIIKGAMMERGLSPTPITTPINGAKETRRQSGA